jgi:hypothetical protein
MDAREAHEEIKRTRTGKSKKVRISTLVTCRQESENLKQRTSLSLIHQPQDPRGDSPKLNVSTEWELSLRLA